MHPAPPPAALAPPAPPAALRPAFSASRRSLSSRTSRTSHTTRSAPSTAPSSRSHTPPRLPKGDTNVTISVRKSQKNIIVSHHYDDGFSSEGHSLDDDYTDSQEYSTDGDYDDGAASDWDLIDEDGEDVHPSDSASRPHVRIQRSLSRPAAPRAPSAPSVPSAPSTRQPRRSATRGPPPAPEPSRTRSSSRGLALEHGEPTRLRRRHRSRSAHQAPEPDSQEDTGDDFPYAVLPQPPPPGGHLGGQWPNIPPQPPNGYAPSVMSYQPPGTASPPGPLVPGGYPHDPYYPQHSFAPTGPNPFSPQQPASDRGGYFPGEYPPPPPMPPPPGHGPGPSHGARGSRGNRNSMPPQSEIMMPYSPGGYPQYPHYAQPHMPYYGYGHPSPSPAHHSSKRHTPRPHSPDDHAMVVMPAPPPPPPVPVAVAATAPPDTAREDMLLVKFERLLSGKDAEDQKKAEEARIAAENAKFSRLEDLIISEKEARLEKMKAKREAADKAAADAEAAKQRGNEDTIQKLHELFLAQKDEQLKREAAAEAKAKADKEAADAAAAKDAADKAAAAEAAKLLLGAAEKAREEAEKKAAAEAEETKKAHEKALAEAKAATDELEKGKKAAEEEAAKLKPSDAPKAPIKFKDAVGRKFSFPWDICKTWNGMEELIKQAFLHVEIIGPHVHQGHYDLVGPDGEIILPQIWDTMIQPDWTITMHMWPMPEPPPAEPAAPPPPPPAPEKKPKGKKKPVPIAGDDTIIVIPSRKKSKPTGGFLSWVAGNAGGRAPAKKGKKA